MGTLDRVSPDSRVNSGTTATRWPWIREKKGFSGCLVTVSTECQLATDRGRGRDSSLPYCGVLRQTGARNLVVLLAVIDVSL